VSVTIGHITFDDVDYDSRGDVLYLSVGEARAATDSEETPEGHVVRYGAEGEVIGLTLINPRWLIDNEGVVTVTLPRAERVEANDIEPLLTPA
jgi:uncharacterized protein YuzE